MLAPYGIAGGGEDPHRVTEVEPHVHAPAVRRQPVRAATRPDKVDPPPARHHGLVHERIEVNSGPARHGDRIVVEERDDLASRQLDGPVAGPESPGRGSSAYITRGSPANWCTGSRPCGFRTVVDHEDVQAIRSDVFGQQAANRRRT